MRVLAIAAFLLVTVGTQYVNAQRITTIQLDGVQYFVSRMNPYSPELNYFLAYQYCRSLGLQLASFESREKADSITQYLSNAGYTKYDFWTSGNRLGTDMFLWMSTGLPFNATFNYMKRSPGAGTQGSASSPLGSAGAPLDPTAMEVPSGSTAPQRTARHNGDSGSTNGCVALRAPTLEWDTADCTEVKDFICEQTRCYYYNYGSIPVSSAQGKPLSLTTTTTPLPPTTPYVMTSTTQQPLQDEDKQQSSEEASEEQKQAAPSDSTEEDNHSAEEEIEEDASSSTSQEETRATLRHAPELDSATRFSLSDLINTLRPHNQPSGKAASLMNLQHEPKDLGPHARHHHPQIDGHYSGINVLSSNSEVDQHHSDAKSELKPEPKPEPKPELKPETEFTTFMSLASDTDVNNTPTDLPAQPDNALNNEEEAATNGPYAADHHELPQGDDPNAGSHDEFVNVEADHHETMAERDSYVSTVLPDVTTFKYMQSVRGLHKQTETEH